MYFDGSGDIFLLCDCTVSFHIAHELWIELCIESLYTVVNMKHSLNFIILIGIEKLKDILGLLHIGLILWTLSFDFAYELCLYCEFVDLG